MQLLKDLLKAVIAYQDVMDDCDTYNTMHSNPRINKCLDLQHKMLDLVDKAKKYYPSLTSGYEFGFKQDRQEEFDNLQKFIDDFSDPITLQEKSIPTYKQSMNHLMSLLDEKK